MLTREVITGGQTPTAVNFGCADSRVAAEIIFDQGLGDIFSVRVAGNVINTEPTPDHVSLGMKVRLATYVLGTDDNGTEAIGFGFEPAN